VSGVPFTIYWLAQFIVDIIQLTIVSVLSIAIFVAFQVLCYMSLMPFSICDTDTSDSFSSC